MTKPRHQRLSSSSLPHHLVLLLVASSTLLFLPIPGVTGNAFYIDTIPTYTGGTGNLNLCHDILTKIGMYPLLDDETQKTFFCPSDAAMAADTVFNQFLVGLDDPGGPRYNTTLFAIMAFHTYPNDGIPQTDIHEKPQIFDGVTTELPTYLDKIPGLLVDQTARTIHGANFIDAMPGNDQDKKVKNWCYLHVVDKVLLPDVMRNANSFRIRSG